MNAYRNHFTNYPAAEGNLDLRESIASFLKEREELDYSPEEILVASGGRPLIYSLFRAIVDKGDKMIYAVPSWNNNHYTHFVGGEHVLIETNAENNFMPTADDMQPHIKGSHIDLSLFSAKSNRYDHQQKRSRSDLRHGPGRKCKRSAEREKIIPDV